MEQDWVVGGDAGAQGGILENLYKRPCISVKGSKKLYKRLSRLYKFILKICISEVTYTNFYPAYTNYKIPLRLYKFCLHALQNNFDLGQNLYKRPEHALCKGRPVGDPLEGLGYCLQFFELQTIFLAQCNHQNSILRDFFLFHFLLRI